MNALVNIQLEAQVIVEQLADRQINEMKERYNEYQEWVQIASNPVMRDSYYNDNNSIDENESMFKFVST
jgi:CHASE1-domain containing sensor protein